MTAALTAALFFFAGFFTCCLLLALSQEVALPNPVMLKPYRTFREIEQPPSSFVLRVKEGNAVALFEADGGRWKHEAILSIREYLAGKLPDMTIVA